MNRIPSLGRVMLIHSTAFLFLIVVSVATGGSIIYLQQESARQAKALNQMVDGIQVLRGDLYRQLKEVFDYVFVGDPDALVEFEALGEAIAGRLERLRGASINLSADLGGQVESLDSAYARVLGRARSIMNQTQAGFPPRALLEVFETELEKGQMLQYEQTFQATDSLVRAANLKLERNTRQFTVLAMAALVVPLIAGVALLAISRRLLKRQVAEPVGLLVQAAEVFRDGRLEHRVPEAGPSEFLTLQQAFNRMAEQLKESQGALVLAEKQAVQGALVPIIAHNIRNPLASIRATAQVMAAPELSRDQREGLEGIVRTVDRLDGWVSQLLDYLNPQEARFVPVSVAAVLDQAQHMVEHGVQEKALRVDRQIDGDATLIADRDLLEQALCGLLANAVEASPPGAALRVGLREDEATVRVSIVDQGPGMPFANISADTGPGGFGPGPTTKAAGSGLGVPFARKICEIHGGALTFHADPGGGTEARVVLPKGREFKA
ncbi:MAG: HAMP domain-containing protein [Kiloniellales bacterium]|nr:HAMP domain-containing protein [Kiloniellales bacterium]